jgi:hypothetical protein
MLRLIKVPVLIKKITFYINKGVSLLYIIFYIINVIQEITEIQDRINFIELKSFKNKLKVSKINLKPYLSLLINIIYKIEKIPPLRSKYTTFILQPYKPFLLKFI